MNLCETEALTFDPESRRRLNLQLLMFFCFFFKFPHFFSFFFLSLPLSLLIWVGKCAWCLFGGEVSVWKKKNEHGGKTSGFSASSISCLNPGAPKRTSHKHFKEGPGGVGKTETQHLLFLDKLHRMLEDNPASPLHQVSFTQLMYKLAMYVLSVEVADWSHTNFAIG